ncbi:MAG: hypothetical protein IPK50_23430 [Fibrobacterota bacterium]|nr:hypothetical protein [Fibrobacterota bacterium]QQS05186.1 MAG: hypothetical protein IPK50_23430 [Fibrobacterota bacterium]
MTPHRSTAWAAIALSLAGCALDRSAGNSMETENSVSARALSVDSLLRENLIFDTGLTVTTVRLDRTNFDFSNSDSTGKGLGFARENGTSIPFEIHFWDARSKLGSVRVRIERDLRLPFARSRILMQSGLGPNAPKSDSLGTWKGISSSWRLRLTSVLVDDFEDANSTTRLPFPTSWRAGTVIGYTYTNPTNVAADSGRLGRAMHFTYTAPSPEYGVVATPLNGPRSLRGMDSLVFWARGNGKVRVAFEHLTGNSGPKSWTTRALNTAWTRYRIRPQDLDPADGIASNVGWLAVRDSVTDLSFITQGGTEIYLDDIRLHGITPIDLR